MMEKAEKEFKIAEMFAKSYFLGQECSLEKANEPIDILASTPKGDLAWELTTIVTNQSGFAENSFNVSVTNELQVKLKELGYRHLHFCLNFCSGAHMHYKKRKDAVDVLVRFIRQNTPKTLGISEVYEFEIQPFEKVNNLLEHLQCIALSEESELEICQAGAAWGGGLTKQSVQDIINRKDKLLSIKRALLPNNAHWLIMVLENSKGSIAGYWDELQNDTFVSHFDACFLYEMHSNKYLQLKTN